MLKKCNSGNKLDLLPTQTRRMNNEPLLPPGVTRAICDKLYDRRKNAALEVEGLVKNLAAQVGELSSFSVIA